MGLLECKFLLNRPLHQAGSEGRPVCTVEKRPSVFIQPETPSQL